MLAGAAVIFQQVDDDMGAAVAAILAQKERELVEQLRLVRATSPANARTLDELQVDTRVAWHALIRLAVIREAAPGRYYLDEPSWIATVARRRRTALVLVVLLLFAGVALYILYRR